MDFKGCSNFDKWRADQRIPGKENSASKAQRLTCQHNARGAVTRHGDSTG